MDSLLVSPTAVYTIHTLTRFLRWARQDDGNEADSAPGRLIWLAVGIAVAVAATGFAITLFNNAKARVPDPTPPIP